MQKPGNRSFMPRPDLNQRHLAQILVVPILYESAISAVRNFQNATTPSLELVAGWDG